VLADDSRGCVAAGGDVDGREVVLPPIVAKRRIEVQPAAETHFDAGVEAALALVVIEQPEH
jgi:hypothetical protein